MANKNLASHGSYMPACTARAHATNHKPAEKPSLTSDRYKHFGGWVALLQQGDASLDHRGIRAAINDGQVGSTGAFSIWLRLAQLLGSGPVRHHPPLSSHKCTSEVSPPKQTTCTPLSSPEAQACALKGDPSAVRGIGQHEGHTHNIDIAGQRGQLAGGGSADPRVAPGLAITGRTR